MKRTELDKGKSEIFRRNPRCSSAVSGAGTGLQLQLCPPPVSALGIVPDRVSGLHPAITVVSVQIKTTLVKHFYSQFSKNSAGRSCLKKANSTTYYISNNTNGGFKIFYKNF